MNDNKISFEAFIIKGTDVMSGTYIEFPYDVKNIFGKSGRIKVKCWFDEIEYRGSLVKMGTECHIVGIRKDILKKLNKKEGDILKVRMKEDTEERTIEIHPLLQEYLKSDNSIQVVYEKLSYTCKKEYNQYLSEAKKPETQDKRLFKIIKMLEEKKK